MNLTERLIQNARLSVTPVTDSMQASVTVKPSIHGAVTEVTAVTDVFSDASGAENFFPEPPNEWKNIGGGFTPKNPSKNPLMELCHFDELHAVQWSDAQNAEVIKAEGLAIVVGVLGIPAAWYAEQKVWRTLVKDDRKPCIECQHYSHDCASAHGFCQGKPKGRKEFFRLHRCDDFMERGGK